MPSSLFPMLLFVPLLPLCAWLLQVVIGSRLPRQGDWLPTTAMAGSFGIAVWLYLQVLGTGGAAADLVWSTGATGSGFQWKWLVSLPEMNSGLASFQAGLLFDSFTAPLLVMVSGVSLLVHLFSTGYMKGNSRYGAYFAGLALFSAAMLAMLVSDNLLFVFAFWEIMGLCSFLLIGHDALDHHKPRPAAASAAVKAFLTTRVGDVALLIGLAILWNGFGTLEFNALAQLVPQTIESNAGWPAWLETAGFLVFLGAVGKSAQFPLHVWLPDAMEGPTPVSAMIHAATMVAAGVYLLARTFPIMAPAVLAIIAVVGAFTALFAATIALTQDDLKKVLAYSTISQLGFMVAAVGAGSPEAGMFHVLTHGLFKAGLFLGAGAVIYACHHQQDMRQLGGLRKRMPLTFVSFLLCTAAISGVPFLSGFYSKDAVLAFSLQAAENGAGLAAWMPAILLIAAAALTPLYMFRALFLTFAGEARSQDAEQAREVPATMFVPLLILGFGAIFGALLWLAKPHPSEKAHSLALTFASLALLLGLSAAVLLFGLRKLDAEKVVRRLGPLPEAARKLYGIDTFYQRTILKPGTALGQLCAWVDRAIIDGVVHGLGRASIALGDSLRRVQDGRLQQYIYFTYGGLALMVVYALWRVS